MKNQSLLLRLTFICNFFIGLFCCLDVAAQDIRLEVLQEFSINSKVGKLRAIPVQLSDQEHAILCIYSQDKEIDPWIEMFYPPSDNLKMTLFDLKGNRLWHKELGYGVINGIWFTPVFPFDMNQDGRDEIYFVNNTDSIHLLSLQNRYLEALDAQNGESIGRWRWKRYVESTLSHTFRNFILGGYENGKPVLVTAQGTYGEMGLDAWNSDMSKKWHLMIEKDEPGPRGSHQCPVVDIDGDGVDEIFWGERCIRVDNGEYVFVADREEYYGHSDVIQPTLNRKDDQWYIFTCRESGDKGQIKPRVVMYDQKGQRVWTDLEMGHMDMGWTAHTNDDGDAIAFTISRGGKIAGPQGFFRTNVVEYAYDAYSGKRIELPFKAYNTVPVDLNGDGLHEFACALGEQADQKIYNVKGEVLGHLGEKTYIAMASKILDVPGEQILCYYPDGRIRIWGDKLANDTEMAKKRYQHPFYQINRRLTGTGYNMVNLGGL